MPVPFLGRLNITEYVALVGSFFLVGLEALIRVLTLALPSSLLDLFYAISRRLFNRWRSPAQKRAEERRKSTSESIRNASDFVDICSMFGYTAEEHLVQTKDGYLLLLHRLAWKKGEEETRVNRGPNSTKKRVVYLHHGLLMNSEVWVCLTDAQRCLPFVLVERGFDVWLGNNRGNKYSKKSVNSSPTSTEFWNFSIDEFAFHDIPDSISYILETTSQESLSYIGFSQGTAQAFASLAIHPKLNDQVNVFIALAPAMSPAGLSNGIVDALVKASPQVLFLLFGRRSILSSATMWQSILYPPLFTKVIDIGLSFLFNWKTANISVSQKLAAYPHLYSFTSTKSVVHWFQIIRTQSFQMYDDDMQTQLLLSRSNKYTKVAKYPTRNIKTPIVLVYGGSDSLVDIEVMRRELPAQTIATEIPHYEHLDFLWARDVDTQVFRHVFDALDSFTGAEHTKEEYERYRSARHTSLSTSNLTKRHMARISDLAVDSDVSTAVGGSVGDDGQLDSPIPQDSAHRKTSIDGRSFESEPGPSSSAHNTHSPSPDSGQATALANGNLRRTRSHGVMRTTIPENNEADLHSSSSSSHDIRFDDVLDSAIPNNVRDGSPDVADGRSPTSMGSTKRRQNTGGSHMSLDSMKAGRGISLGTSRAVGGVTTSGGPQLANLLASADQGTKELSKTSLRKASSGSTYEPRHPY
ncbi:Alpha/Beta hydrolase protein [Rhypophila decipiens]|uniref:Alpha/Beta hydrolase protein n=1 Tax=Rhypophila decipiens TaxID=261697 RepID=A0AAN6XXX3_9PEZI|nr:Alpha/Beta hydrolase protein [Rhypophila decipiens]